jgi:hypothetical protein
MQEINYFKLPQMSYFLLFWEHEQQFKIEVNFCYQMLLTKRQFGIPAILYSFKILFSSTM